MAGSIGKEMFLRHHERLTEERMEHAGEDFSTAYDKTGEAAMEAVRDEVADRVDTATEQAKEKGYTVGEPHPSHKPSK